MKVVLDTNVLIDGFKDEYSYEKRIIDEVVAGNIEAYANRQTMQENRLILGQIIENPEYEDQMNNFFCQLNYVVNRRQIKIVRDPEDNKILESAVEAGADYLITRDNDLLRIEAYENIQIVNPSEFWVKFKDDGEDIWKQWAGFMNSDK